MIQTGDPSGTGRGGESVYGSPFKDEFHQRLKFSRRGIVGMANSGVADDNSSQFFITLGACEHLNRKHTIFGKVTGDTIYNVLRLEETEVDQDDRPEEPPKIIRVDVISNPFPDIVPRSVENELGPAEEDRDKPKKKKKGKKNTKLLSFGEGVDDEGDGDLESVGLKVKSVFEMTERKKKKRKEKDKRNGSQIYDKSATVEQPASGDALQDDVPSLGRYGIGADKTLEGEGRGGMLEEVAGDKLPKEDEEVDESNYVHQRKKPRGLDGSFNDKPSLNRREEKKNRKGLEYLNDQRERYARKKQKGDREMLTLSALSDFTKDLGKGKSNWMNHSLKFEKDETAGGVDPNRKDDDDWEIIDPRLSKPPKMKERRREGKKNW